MRIKIRYRHVGDDTAYEENVTIEPGYTGVLQPIANRTCGGGVDWIAVELLPEPPEIDLVAELPED